MKLPNMLVLALSLAACSKEAAPPPPAAPPPAAQAVGAMPDWKAAFQHQVAWDPARSAVVVSVSVQPGFHAYTVGESVGKPLELTIAEDSAYGLDGEVQYPTGNIKELPIGKSVIVEGKAEVVAKVKAKTEAKGEVKGSFRYQVCTDEACDRPRTEAFNVPAS